MFHRSLVILWMVTGAALAQSPRNRQRQVNPRTLFDEADDFSGSVPSNRARQQTSGDLDGELSFEIGAKNDGPQKRLNKATRGKFALSDDDDDEARVEAKPVVQTIRRFSVDNEDGTFTFGYENADGTFKEETRGADCVVRGKYGYVDPDGVKREFSYQAGNPCVPGQESVDEQELNDFRSASPQRRPVKGAAPRAPLVNQKRPVPMSTESRPIEEDDGDETPLVPKRAPVQNRPRPGSAVRALFDEEETGDGPVDVLSIKAKVAIDSLRNRNQQPAEQRPQRQQQKQQQKQQQQQQQQRPPVVVRADEPARNSANRRPPGQPDESTIDFDDELKRLTNPNPVAGPVGQSAASAPSAVDFEAESNRSPARPSRRRPVRPSQRALSAGDN